MNRAKWYQKKPPAHNSKWKKEQLDMCMHSGKVSRTFSNENAEKKRTPSKLKAKELPKQNKCTNGKCLGKAFSGNSKNKFIVKQHLFYRRNRGPNEEKKHTAAAHTHMPKRLVICRFAFCLFFFGFELI